MSKLSRWRRVGLSVFALALVGSVGAPEAHAQAAEACSPDQPFTGPARSNAPVTVWDGDRGRSIDGPVDPDLAAALDTELEMLLTRYPAASVAVAIPGEGTWAAAGSGSVGQSSGVTNSTPFRAASITKPVVAVLVMQLAAEGRLRLDDTLDAWFPDVPNAGLITIDHLLTHTSGLVSFNALPADAAPADAGYRSPEELIELASRYPPLFCPGTSWSYTNTGYVLLGRILEKTAETSLSDLIQTRIAEPLGLSSLGLPSPGDEPQDVPTGHEGLQPISEPTLEYATPWAAGGLVSTAGDLARFWHAYLAGELVSQEAVRGAFTDMYSMQPQFPAPPGTDLLYGRGVQLTRAPGGDQGPGPLLEHSGGIRGFNAMMAYAADDDAFIVVMSADQQVPAAAGVWRLLQVVRRHRAARP